MFKWICLAVAVVFLSVLTWMLNDMRLELRRSSELLQKTGKTINEHLPAIVDKTRKTTDSLAEHLPEIVQKLRTTASTVAELTEDIRQLRELVGLAGGGKRDDGLVAYANSVLGAVEKSGGVIGLKKLGGRGLKNPVPAKEWVVGARREALVLSLLARSRAEMLTRLGKNKFGFNWYLQVGDGEPVTLIDWLKANHPPTQELEKSGARPAKLDGLQGFFPPSEIRCVNVRRYIRPPATAGVACVPSPSAFRASCRYAREAASTNTSPSRLTLNSRSPTHTGEA
jgi:hypothetical protein